MEPFGLEIESFTGFIRSLETLFEETIFKKFISLFDRKVELVFKTSQGNMRTIFVSKTQDKMFCLVVSKFFKEI